MIIKILGSGCSKCDQLVDNTEEALKTSGISAEVIKVTELKDIMAYGVMTTPALVVDEKVVACGKILKPQDIIKYIAK